MEPDSEGMERAIRDYGEVEAAGRRVVVNWLGHEAVREDVPKLRPMAEAIIDPIARHLVDQIQVSRFIARILDMALIYPDFTEESNPFTVWDLTEAERGASEQVAKDFSGLLFDLANQLRAGGVLLDPEGPENLYALGQLLLLPIDLDLPADELMEFVNGGPSGTVYRNGRGLELSDHVGRSDGAVWQRIRGRQRERAGGAFIRSPYAGGTSRRTPSATERRRAALATVLSAYPGVTDGELLANWHSSSNTSGGLLRELMKLPQDAARPSRTTIGRDRRALRGGGTASAES